MSKRKSIAINPRDASSYYSFSFDEKFLKTDLIAFDAILGGNGIPSGSFIELRGDAGVGKTSLMLHACANLCSNGYKVVYIDTEGSISAALLEGTGAKLYLNSSFVLIKQSLYEDVEKVLDCFINDDANRPHLFVIDSVAGLAKSSTESFCDLNIGQDSSLMSRFFKKYNVAKRLYNLSFIFLNQTRIRVNTRGTSDEISPGGKALEFFMDARIRLYKLHDIKENLFSGFNEGSRNTKIGSELIIEAFKSKFSKPFVSIPIYLIFGRGISNALTLIDILMNKQTNFNDGFRSVIKKLDHESYSFIFQHEEQILIKQNLLAFIRDNYDEIYDSMEPDDFLLVKD